MFTPFIYIHLDVFHQNCLHTDYNIQCTCAHTHVCNILLYKNFASLMVTGCEHVFNAGHHVIAGNSWQWLLVRHAAEDHLIIHRHTWKTVLPKQSSGWSHSDWVLLPLPSLFHSHSLSLSNSLPPNRQFFGVRTHSSPWFGEISNPAVRSTPEYTKLCTAQNSVIRLNNEIQENEVKQD